MTPKLDLFKNILFYIVKELNATNIYIDKLENGNLAVDWDGSTPAYDNVIPSLENLSEYSPLQKLSNHIESYSIIARHNEQLVRLEIVDGVVVSSEVTTRKTGSRLVLIGVDLCEIDFHELINYCDDLALNFLLLRFEIYDFKSANTTVISIKPITI